MFEIFSMKKRYWNFTLEIFVRNRKCCTNVVLKILNISNELAKEVMPILEQYLQVTN